ncbi:hypothetical protein BDA99DRAFT_524491 [Phascolomyces articulosus]|uniref:Lipoprotein n=1 Tax=Phascolomyces articulosus TaxID=60185 RepID=A0AAD5P8R8_9FUNG|nr:hypothetical protein BDA99DRAFT_524491 [Phascolomyces articulosus]
MPNLSSIFIATGVAILAFATAGVTSAPAQAKRENSIQVEHQSTQVGDIAAHAQKRAEEQGEGFAKRQWWHKPHDFWA